MTHEQPAIADPSARIEPGRGGLERVIIRNDLADSEIYLHGAHVTHFQPRAQTESAIFLSTRSLYGSDSAIRGGVPLCFPWFGPNPTDPKLPQHGFARVMTWNFAGATRRQGDGATQCIFRLESNDQTKQLWPEDFSMTYTVTTGPALTMSLEVLNRSPERTIRFTEALHSYLLVGDVRRASISGLESSPYLDKTQNHKRIEAAGMPLKFAGETDRVYLDARGACTVDDPVLGRRVVVEKSGSNSTVVWNPWDKKAAGMTDLGDDQWPAMLCIEAANVGDAAITLAPGASHKMVTTIRVE